MRWPTIGEMFLGNAARDPSAPFLRWWHHDQQHAISFRQAVERAAAIITYLRGQGLKKGDRLVWTGHDLAPALELNLACAISGIVHVPAPSSALTEVIRLMGRVDTKHLWTTAEDAGPFADEGLEPLCFADPAAPGRTRQIPMTWSGGYDAALALLQRESAAIGPDDLYMLQPTSGSTGEPKLVMRSHKPMGRVADVMGCGLEPGPGHRVLMVMTITHGFGQYNLSVGMRLGAEFVVPSAIDINAPLEEVRAFDPTWMGATPRVLKAWVAQAGGMTSGERVFGPTNAILVTGGTKADYELLGYLQGQGIGVVEAYGATEFSLVARGVPGRWKPGVIGPILPDCQLKFTPEGELLAKTEVFMLGYWGDPESTKKAFTEDGFYKTGDGCALSPEGELYYKARVKDVLNTFTGANVYPQLAEEEIMKLTWVRQVALFGDQKPYIAALVVPVPEIWADGVDASLAQRLAADFARINSKLEVDARIRTARLLRAPFPDDLYKYVGHGKINRNRPGLAGALAADFAALFQADAPGTIAIPGSAKELRRASRQDARMLVRYQLAGTWRCDYTRDASRTGLFIAAEGVAAVTGAAVAVQLHALGTTPITLEARVVRTSSAGFAIEFTDREASRRLLEPILPA